MPQNFKLGTARLHGIWWYLCLWQEAELREAVAALQCTVSASKERLQRKATHLEERRETASGMVGGDSVHTHICTYVYNVFEWKNIHNMNLYIWSYVYIYIFTLRDSRDFCPHIFCWHLLMHFIHTRLCRRHFLLQKRDFAFHENVWLLLDESGMLTLYIVFVWLWKKRPSASLLEWHADVVLWNCAPLPFVHDPIYWRFEAPQNPRLYDCFTAECVISSTKSIGRLGNLPV